MRRDDNEPEIVAALEDVGAVVRRLDPPLPDLLVCWRDTLHLIEVKRITDDRRRIHAGKGGNLDGLTPSQEKWWAEWLADGGKRPAIAKTPAEALRAIGATSNLTVGTEG